MSNKKAMMMISENEIYDIKKFLKEHRLLSELINKNGVLFECYGDAPSPSKDFGQIQITIDKVIIRWWKITLRNIEGSIYPGEIKDSYQDFYHDEIGQREILRIFGQKTLDYCLNFICGQIDWLSYLPLNIQIKIFSFLNLNDIPQLSLVSKLFRTISRHNELWKLFYIQQYGYRYTLNNKDLIHLAERRGWRYIFFTNRLKLQMELRREAQLDDIQLQSSPPTTPRQRQSSNRNHSSAIRKEILSMSPLPNREGSARSDFNGINNSPRILSPSISIQSNTEDIDSTSSSPTYR